MLTWSTLCAAALALPFAICATGAAAAPAVTVTVAENGGTVHLRSDQTLVVRLAANKTTGFSWSVTPGSSAPLALGSRRYELASAAPAGAPPVPGAGGTEILTFTPTRAGTGLLQLAYRRPWKPSDPPAREFALTVVVEALP